jgi:hypothetical protein
MATNPTVGTKGGLLDLLIRQGATCGPNNVALKNSADGTPISLVDCTITGQIRKTADAATALATAVITVVDAANGLFIWEFTATATAALTADPDSETADASKYVWDMEALNTTTTRVIPIFYGEAFVWREVTK